MKNIVLGVVIVLALGVVTWIFVLPPMLCWYLGGAWNYGNQICDFGAVDVGNLDEVENGEGAPGPVAYKDLLEVVSPFPGETVSSPITITGSARGGWYFEASFPIAVVDWDGRIIGEGHAEAQGDWTTNEYVPFVATVTYDLQSDTSYRRGAVILQKDNPSGLPENDDAFEIPVNFQ